MTKLSRAILNIIIILSCIYILQTYFPSKKVLGNELVMSVLNKSISTDALQDLLDKGADINFVRQGVTPLKMAAMANNYNAIKFLIDKGAELNKVTDGTTAMDMACEYQYEKVIEILSKQKAKKSYYLDKTVNGNKFSECEVKENKNASD